MSIDAYLGEIHLCIQLFNEISKKREFVDNLFVVRTAISSFRYQIGCTNTHVRRKIRAMSCNSIREFDKKILMILVSQGTLSPAVGHKRQSLIGILRCLAFYNDLAIISHTISCNKQAISGGKIHL